jgi:hypothetical protein
MRIRNNAFLMYRYFNFFNFLTGLMKPKAPISAAATSSVWPHQKRSPNYWIKMCFKYNFVIGSPAAKTETS